MLYTEEGYVIACVGVLLFFVSPSLRRNIDTTVSSSHVMYAFSSDFLGSDFLDLDMISFRFWLLIYINILCIYYYQL